LETPSVSHVRDLLPEAARLMDRSAMEPLLERVRPAAHDPSFQVGVFEAEAILESDPGRFEEAADLYASFEMPYQEARCRLEAGHLERATELIRTFGLEKGPVGTRLRGLQVAKD
jgi:hypothetical protein